MMNPVKFKGHNCVFAKDQKEYLPLPAYKHNDDVGTVSACWKMSIRERIKALRTGKIYISLLTFNNPLTPHRLDVDPPVMSDS